MCAFILKSYSQKEEIRNPHFFILNKGNNSGKPLTVPCPNCFVIQFQCEEEKEQIYWLIYSLWQSKAFYPFLRGSVIPFIVLRDIKSCLLDGVEKVAKNPAQFEKAVAALRSLEAIEKQYKQNLLLISHTKRMLFYKFL
jgi:hypothetical protein